MFVLGIAHEDIMDEAPRSQVSPQKGKASFINSDGKGKVKVAPVLN
jgi:hypothetical protein